MKISHSVIIDNRSYTVFDTELPFEKKTNGLFELAYLNVLRLQGEKTQDFLQGQLTCDIRDINAHQMRQGALCNLQGRIISLSDIIYWHDYLLVLPQDLTTPTLKDLAKPALFSRVKMESTPLAVYGLHLPSKAPYFPWQLPTAPYSVQPFEWGCIYALEQQTYIVIMDPVYRSELISPFIASQQFFGSLAWHVLRLTHGQFNIYPATSGLFLPHYLNLQKTAVLSFDKGCYKGQEIIARMHYRAKLKHTLKQVTLSSQEPLQVGMEIHTEEGTGELVDFYPVAQNLYSTLVIAKNS